MARKDEVIRIVIDLNSARLKELPLIELKENIIYTFKIYAEQVISQLISDGFGEARINDQISLSH